jgi:hypothetical protein
MTWFLAIAVGTVTGLLVGGVAERLPISPVIQSASSALGAAIGSTALTLLAQVYRPTPGGLGAVSFGFGLDNVAWLLVIAGAAGGLHLLLGQVDLPRFIIGHRPMCFGVLSGVLGALQVVRALVTVDHLG